MFGVTDDDIYERLRFENPWWDENRALEAIRRLPRRTFLQPLLALVKLTTVRRAVVLLGPRRVGKTVMLQQAVASLIDDGVPPGQVCYLALDTPLYSKITLEKLLSIARAHGRLAPGAPAYFMLDEVQYLRDWEVHLKVLVDTEPSVRFVASGSAAAALRRKSTESGAGRFTDFLLPALTFDEFLAFRGGQTPDVLTPALRRLQQTDLGDRDMQALQPLDIEALNLQFVDYVNFGGYPEIVVSDTARANIARFVKSDIVDMVLLRDLPTLYGIADIPELNSLFTMLAFNTGNELSLEALAKNSGVAKNTLKRYIDYLEAAFLAKRIERIDRSARRFVRVPNFKVYLTNAAMRAALFRPASPDDERFPFLAETAFVGQADAFDASDHLHYARWDAGEVDFVRLEPGSLRPIAVVEIKWSDRPLERSSELASLAAFLHYNGSGIEDVVVTTRTRSASQRLGEHQIRFVPTSILCWRMGREAVHRVGLAPGERQLPLPY